MPDIPDQHLGNAKTMARDLAAVIVRQNRRLVEPLTPLQIESLARTSDAFWRQQVDLTGRAGRAKAPGNVTRTWAADIAAAHAQADAALDTLQRAAESAGRNLAGADRIDDPAVRARRLETIAHLLLAEVNRAAESLRVPDPVNQPLQRSA